MISDFIDTFLLLVIQGSAFFIIYNLGRLKEKILLLEVLEKIKENLPDEEKK